MEIDIHQPKENYGYQKYHTKWTLGQKSTFLKSSSQEDRIIPNLYPPNKIASKYMSKINNFKDKHSTKNKYIFKRFF